MLYKCYMFKKKLLLSSGAGSIDWPVGEVAENCSYGLDLSERERDRERERERDGEKEAENAL